MFLDLKCYVGDLDERVVLDDDCFFDLIFINIGFVGVVEILNDKFVEFECKFVVRVGNCWICEI